MKIPELKNIPELKMTDSLSPEYIIVLDAETTGLDHESDEIIELSMVMIDYDMNILYYKQYYNQPSSPIPQEIKDITNDMVSGHDITDDITNSEIHNLLSGADFIIAHNAEFDRAFIDRYFADLNIPWVCSLKDIDWKGNGIYGSKLENLLMLYGYRYEAHSALNDCNALYHMIKSYDILDELIKVSKSDCYKISVDRPNYDDNESFYKLGMVWHSETKSRYSILDDKEKANKLYQDIKALGYSKERIDTNIIKPIDRHRKWVND